MSETNVAAVSGSGPSFVSVEPVASEPRAGSELMCVNKASEGTQGASGAGTEALVRRFNDPAGAGGGSGYVALPVSEPTSCEDDALRALGTCATTAFFASATGGVGLLVSGISCAGDLGGLVECLTNDDAASKP